MRTLYLECAMGAAGDMLTAALLELHPAPADFLRPAWTGAAGRRCPSGGRRAAAWPGPTSPSLSTGRTRNPMPAIPTTTAILMTTAMTTPQP